MHEKGTLVTAAIHDREGVVSFEPALMMDRSTRWDLKGLHALGL